MRKSKKIGIIGGVDPQATVVLYRRIIEISQDKYQAKNNDDYPSVVIESVPVPDFISDTSKIKKAKKMLVGATKSLTAAGATILSIGSNTPFIFYLMTCKRRLKLILFR
ncbi:aspartate/glutamate racemase family protein [Patescibacteria group bacterium]